MRQFTKDSCVEVKEVKEEVSRWDAEVQQRVGQLEGRLRSVERSPHLRALFSVAGPAEEEMPPCDDDHAGSKDSGGSRRATAGGSGARIGVRLDPTPLPPPPSSPHARHKLQDYDRRVSWDAYLAQFDLLAEAQAWDQWERAIQLVSSLKGAAVEVLSQLTPQQRTFYGCVVAALERRSGCQHQTEAFRARFWAKARMHGDPLQQLAQELEHL